MRETQSTSWENEKLQESCARVAHYHIDSTNSCFCDSTVNSNDLLCMTLVTEYPLDKEYFAQETPAAQVFSMLMGIFCTLAIIVIALDIMRKDKK